VISPPPWVVRRLLVAPVVLVLAMALIAVSPVAVVVACVLDLFLPGRWQALRLTLFVVAYLGCEVVMIAALFVCWIVSGFGLWLRSRWMQSLHYWLMRWWLGAIGLAAHVLFGLRVAAVDGPEPASGPLLVFGRHAGPGNSLMLVSMLLSRYRRRPRIVMLSKLRWDPVFDVLGRRLPNRFIDHRPSRSAQHVEAIAALATGLGDHDAFVLFPEGHDFTPRLRLDAIAHLRDEGYTEEAREAERLTNVLPPRHRGPMAAILAAPSADVAFVAHTVMEDVGSFGALWKNLPLPRSIRARYWRVPAAEVPHDDERLIEWLFSWWERIDGWIDGQRALAENDRAEPARGRRPSSRATRGGAG